LKRALDSENVKLMTLLWWLLYANQHWNLISTALHETRKAVSTGAWDFSWSFHRRLV